MIITPTSLSITQLFGSANEQYVIPAYQRRYSWYERQVWELIDDVRLLEDRDTHLLGSIVCLAGHHTAGLNKLELVDGQQRLATISIVLECIRQRLEHEGENQEAAGLGRLLSAKPLRGASLRKIALDSIDAEEFNLLLRNEGEQTFQNIELAEAFRIIREWVAEQTSDALVAFLYRLTNQAIVIRLDVSDAKDAFKLFETINNRGLRLSPTDIIKNFLLGNAARFGQEPLDTARRSWARLIKELDGTSSDAFFRHFLIATLKRRVTASYVVSSFKGLFMNEVREASKLPERHLYADIRETDDDDNDNGNDEQNEASERNLVEEAEGGRGKISFKQFLEQLVRSAQAYAELVLVKTGEPRIDRHLRNLRMIKAVQTYGFLMHLRVGGCSAKPFREVLRLTENFILRRHICRERANENETLFARLCAVDPHNPVEDTKAGYREFCPTDDRFRDEFATASFPASLIDRARYCLEQIELSQHGDHEELQVLGSDAVHVEHIIPQKIKTQKAKDEFGDWVTYLGERAETLHSKNVSRIGNLTIFAGTLNIGASNNPFGKKKHAYKESGIVMTKKLAKIHQFKFKNVDQRSKDLADLAVKLWPRP